MKKELVTQQSWAGGQINKSAWRRDDVAALKTGSERQENVRVNATEQAEPRPGRRMFCKVSGLRNEYVRVSGIEFMLSFGNGTLQIVALATGLQAATQGGFPWTLANLAQIVWAAADNDIEITFPGMQPQIARYDPIAGTWSFTQFGYLTFQNQVQEPFFRFARDGITLSYTQPTTSWGTSFAGPTPGQVGLAVTASAPCFSSAMIGSVISVMGQQATITAVADSTHATVTVAYILPSPVSCLVDNTVPFVAGQEAQYKIQGIRIEIGSVQQGVGAASPGGTIVGTLMSSALFPGTASVLAGEQLISPLGFANVTFGPNTSGAAKTVQWQEEFMSAVRGWPRACAFGRRRLRFFDFPQKQDAILWGTIDHPDMFWVDEVAAALYPQAGTRADNAMLEFVGDDEGAPRILHVVDWGDEFIFTDRGIWQIPISATNPLKPGSVEFRKLSNDGVAAIPPVVTADAVVFINAGRQRVSALKGAPLSTSARPFIVDDVSEPHSDLFTGPIAMALTTGDGPKPERYVYVLNADGSLVVGKFTADRQFVGWAPWTSQIAPLWITAAGATVYLTVQHGAEYWIETEDMTIDLDSGVFINALPASVSASRPGGQGPLWFLAGRTIALVDLLPAGPLDKGDYAVDANGFIVPNQPGEDLTSLTLYAGLTVTMTDIPLVPMPGAGESTGQRQHRRKVSEFRVTYQNAQAPFKIGTREISPYKFGDDANLPPSARDDSKFIRPLGRSYDPSNAITKTRPGPLRIVEISQEVTV